MFSAIFALVAASLLALQITGEVGILFSDKPTSDVAHPIDHRSVHFDNADVAEDDKIVFVQSVWRHGDRSPSQSFKSDVYQEDAWPQGFGELTTKGMEQQFKLGKKLQKRYITDLKLLQPSYNSREIYIRSTDWNRTISSATSNFIGFYHSENSEDTPTIPGWPKEFIPIPIHTVTRDNDSLGNIGEEAHHCGRLAKLAELTKKTPEYQKIVANNKEFLVNLTQLCGEDITADTIYTVRDTLFVEKIYNKLPDWCTDEIYQRVMDIETQLRDLAFGLELKPYSGVNFALEIARLMGGPLLWHFIDHMQAKTACDIKDGNYASSKSVPKSCQWLNKLKYYAFSAHDDTISALLIALGTNKTSMKNDGIPYYTTAITVELWRTKNDTYNVKVLYWDPKANSFEIVTDKVSGCKSDSCPLDQFINRSRDYMPVPNIDELCANENLGDDAGNTAATLSLSLLVGIFALLAVFANSRVFTHWP